MQGATAKCSRVNVKPRPNIQTRYHVGSRAVGTANRCRGSFCVIMRRCVVNPAALVYVVAPRRALAEKGHFPKTGGINPVRVGCVLSPTARVA